jgi:cytochrome bd-type quinol oxidase subunit 2
MLPPWLKLVTGQPQLLAEHAEAYGELLQAEAAELSTAWRRQAVLVVLAVASAVVAVVLAGVALMLWATLAPAQGHAPWLLWTVPMLPLATAGLCTVLARQRAPAVPFGVLRQQLRADWGLLREAESP